MKAKITMSNAKAVALAGLLLILFPELAWANYLHRFTFLMAWFAGAGFFLFTLCLISSFIVDKINGKRWERPNSRFLLKSAFWILSFSFVISLIAAPNFIKIAARSPQSEAKNNLGAISIAQRYYFSNANTYAAGADVFQKINWEPAGQNRYAYYCDSAVIPNKIVNFNLPLPDKKWPVKERPKSSQTGFTCMAIGNIDNDDALDVWSINDGKYLVNLFNDV